MQRNTEKIRFLHILKKESGDVVIRGEGGHIVHQYQFKYGKDADATIQMLKHGNYNNQTLVVPPEQVEAVQAAFPGKTVVSQIGGTEKDSDFSERHNLYWNQ